MKKDKIKKESFFKKKINELKKTTRGKAIWKLIKWGIFFFIIFIFLGIASLIGSQNNKIKPNINNDVKEPIRPPAIDNKENETLTNEGITKFQTKLSKVYDYKYEITINHEKYIYTGTKTLVDNIGFKESSLGIIKYLIDSTGTYEETTTDKKAIDNLYEGLNVNYLDPIYVLNIIKNLEITRDLECDCIDPVYKASDSENIYRITTINKEITSISITALDFSYLYNLNFSNIR